MMRLATFLALSSSYYGATALTANVDNVGSTIGGSSSTSTTTTDSSDIIEASSTSNRRGGIRSSPEPQAQAQTQAYHVPIGSDKPKLRSKKNKNKKNNKSTSGSGNNPIQSFAVNMLQSQGCPVSTSSCGDICYVLTPAAASDLHSVAIGTSNTPHHHWHDPTSFWTTGVCNGKSQCVSVNPFDDDHNFDDLANTLLDVEKECERSVGMATMFILAKAMEPPAWVKQKQR